MNISSGIDLEGFIIDNFLILINIKEVFNILLPIR